MGDRNEVVETLKAAKSYLNHLENLNKQLENAENQICETSSETERNIEVTFSNLLTNLTEILLNRKDILIKKVQKTRKQSLAPLDASRSDIFSNIEKTKKLIKEGEYLLSGSRENLAEFSQKSSFLGSLPAIPELKEVPYISFHCEPNLESELLDICSQFGEVSRIAPVQISQTVEKPGAILVEWQSVDDERCVDIQEFRLQRAFGDVISEKHLEINFSDCYVGAETQFLVKDLRPNQLYSFRVCCKFEGSSDWSPWSLSQVTRTSIKPFSWASNRDFVFADDNKIATPVKDAPSLLLSDGPQFAVGYSVEFSYLEIDNKCSTIALIAVKEAAGIKEIRLGDHSYFALDSTGEIYVDGVKKATKLPEAAKGFKICFMCELIQDDKVRVSIDTCNKQVTYDWQISKTDKLYFGALLKSPATKIMVE
ncbi:Cytokine receptor-like factor 3 [Tribolium castaneum]|uniref:Cytokine receptor-like factor 3 n=1 Tax=Tribolium castaneum TaxID=7070 RepID=D6WC72_TRICA|nr:PREDICTED: cytokine receptor-like factor 3 [Tribolium castaneum]EEZ97840.1 Cytokine receptor-like factor 3 [Tribolium castaneum]|eukprot:XP_008190449.1 PREDICTED: cytokine receptor-like factor 3 [Tribolium castaneum]